MQDRIKKIRKSLGLNQTEFGKKVGVKGNTIGNYEIGLRNPSEAVIFSICREFNVNEEWLRNGGSDDDMFVQLSPVEEVAAYTQDILDSVDDDVADFVKNFIVVYGKLDDNSKSVLKQFAKDMLERTKKDLE